MNRTKATRFRLGCCIDCGRPRERVDLMRCNRCNDKMLKGKRNLHKTRQQARLCRDCGVSIETGLCCDSCHVKRNNSVKALRAARRANKQCPDCGTPVKRFVYCTQHRVQNTMRFKASRAYQLKYLKNPPVVPSKEKHR